MSDTKVFYRGVIQPWQCDSIGHFTTRFYMAMFDDASWHFLYEAGFDTRLMKDENIGWADVLHNIEYKQELHAGDLVIIEGTPLHIGGKSIRFELEMKRVDSDECCARFTSTTVQFDLKRRVAIPVIPAVREKLQAWVS
jgi:acyl-CoA thioester hydrolase